MTDVLNKVTSGQADAGVVYVTDALAAGDKVATVNFAESAVAVNMYPDRGAQGCPESGPGDEVRRPRHGRLRPKGTEQGRIRQAVRTAPALPRWIYLPAALGALFVVLPLVAVVAKVDWPQFWSLITSESSRRRRCC